MIASELLKTHKEDTMLHDSVVIVSLRLKPRLHGHLDYANTAFGMLASTADDLENVVLRVARVRNNLTRS